MQHWFRPVSQGIESVVKALWDSNRQEGIGNVMEGNMVFFGGGYFFFVPSHLEISSPFGTIACSILCKQFQYGAIIVEHYCNILMQFSHSLPLHKHIILIEDINLI